MGLRAGKPETHVNAGLAGQRIINRIGAMAAEMRGIASRVYSCIAHFIMPQTANMATPTGGVIEPGVAAVIMNRPK